MYKQVIGIYMHAQTLTSLGTLLYIALASHTLSAQGEACDSTYITGILYFGLCTTVSHYYRETCFELATCADFSIFDFGEL